MSEYLMIALLVFTLIAWCSAPYWWSKGWWRLPVLDALQPAKQRKNEQVRLLKRTRFDVLTGQFCIDEGAKVMLQRQINLQDLQDRLARLGGQTQPITMPPPIEHDRCCEDCGTACAMGDRFCHQCGIALKEPAIDPRVSKKRSARVVALQQILLAGFIAFSTLQATPGFAVPPMLKDKVGVLNGTLSHLGANGQPQILANKKFTVEVRMGPKVVVRVEKTTDAMGHYSIGNVFAHPTLRYYIVTTIENRSYRSKPMGLAPDQRLATIDVVLKPGPGLDEPITDIENIVEGIQQEQQQMAAATMEAQHESTGWRQSQQFAALLCVVAALFILGQWRSLYQHNETKA